MDLRKKRNRRGGERKMAEVERERGRKKEMDEEQLTEMENER